MTVTMTTNKTTRRDRKQTGREHWNNENREYTSTSTKETAPRS